MRKLIAILTAATVIIALLVSSMAMVSHAARDTDWALVGAIASGGWEDFSDEDLEKVSKLVRYEFGRTSRLRSEMHSGKKYFYYGEPENTLLHAADFSEEFSDDPQSPDFDCMIQDFSGGYSTCLQIFGHPVQWCCIVVTRESFEKGEAYTIRDAVAYRMGWNDSFQKWGLPTSNQYWVEEDGQEILYQQFENGYFRSIDGTCLSAFSEFHYKSDEENYDPDFPKTGAEDRPSWGSPKPWPPEPVSSREPSSTFSWIEPSEPSDESYASNLSVAIPQHSEIPDSDYEETDSPGIGYAAEVEDNTTSYEEIAAENTVPSTENKTAVKKYTVRHNSPFYQFLLDHYIALTAGGAVIITGAAAVVIIAVKKRGKTKSN